MIRGVHTMFYSTKPEELRAFLRDVIGLSGVDIGDGWIIFDLPEGDMGVHPTMTGGADDGNLPSGTRDISFYCDDVHATVAELTSKGVEFTTEIEDHGYGLVTFFKAPGDFTIQLYQPKYSKG
jgi:catechol 2,3-dioxygenase-like lactoylglutathione lyase family enzyme